jgi:hypothetical protein
MIYLADRAHWLDIAQLKGIPSLILVGGILIVSYVLGHITEPLAAGLDRRLRLWKSIYNVDVRKEFVSRVPGAAHRAYVQSDLSLLLAASEASEKDAAPEISRLRAVGLMLRNCSVPFLCACVTAIVEAVIGNHRPIAILSSIAFAAATLSSIRQGKRLREWANMKTLEICYWIPGIDDKVQDRTASPKRSTSAVRRRGTTSGRP